MAGQEDVELVRMRYETTSAFTATAGGASYLQIKGNSIYRPYPGNTDSPAGYQRLYTQYEQSIVLASRVTVRLWSNTGAGVQQPFRIAAVPCTPTQYTTYSGFSNVAALRGVPHATEKLFSPGAAMPSLACSGTTAQVLLGSKDETAVEASAASSFVGTSGADPSQIWYHLIGLQAMAGTTSLDAQLQVLIEFDVMFRRPVPTAVQQLLSLNFWGNEEVKELKGEKPEERKAVKSIPGISDPEGFELVDLHRRGVTRVGEGSRVTVDSAAVVAALNGQASQAPGVPQSPFTTVKSR